MHVVMALNYLALQDLDSARVEVLQSDPDADGRWILVANLPYQVATPLLMNLLTCEARFERCCYRIVCSLTVAG